jgi:hypothetical protein
LTVMRVVYRISVYTLEMSPLPTMAITTAKGGGGVSQHETERG